MAATLLVSVAAPFWAGRFLPFLDLPQHLGLASVIARHGDPSTRFAHYYTIDHGVTPYWAYYASMWALTRLFALETANRLVFTAYATAVPLGAAYLLGSFGRDRRWAVLSVPLVFSTNLFFGFATFLVSIPLFLFALGVADRHLAAPALRSRQALAVAVLAALVFLGHAQTYLLLGACVLVLLAIRVRGGRALAAAVAPFLPSLLLFAIWFAGNFLDGWRAGTAIHTPYWQRYGTLGRLGAVYEPWRVVFRTIPERLLGAFNDGSDARLGLALLGVFAVALVADRFGGPERASTGSVPSSRVSERLLVVYRSEILVGALVLAYFLTPIQVSGQWYLNARYLVFAALAAPLLLRGPVRRWRAALAGVAAVIGVVACANATTKVRQFQVQVAGFDTIARQLPRGGRVLGLPFDLGASGPVRLWPLLHWACWEQVLEGGDVGFSFAGLPSIPVRYRPGMQAPHPYEWRPDQFDAASMGPWYDAFLVSGVPRGRGGAELERYAQPVARAGAWSLWRARNGLTHRPRSSRESDP